MPESMIERRAFDRFRLARGQGMSRCIESAPFDELLAASISDALTVHGLKALRADSKAYHSDLYTNILTYVYGCSFGIAIFERIEQDDFNPNVALF
jgi:hypothetical protein